MPAVAVAAPAVGVGVAVPAVGVAVPAAAVAVPAAAVAASMAPRIVVSPRVAVPEDPRAAWDAIARRFTAAGGALPEHRPHPIEVRAAQALPPGQGGASVPGLIELRDGGAALRHELAHQLLFWACPQASEDRLLHEAFAMAAADEIAPFLEGTWLPVHEAVAVLGRGAGRGLDDRRARRALARVLAETQADRAALPLALGRKLRDCASAGAWSPTTAAELAEGEPYAGLDAGVVVSRHSGEVLIARGQPRRAVPFGSTLKPFVVAGAAAPLPALPPRAASADWSCGEALPSAMDAAAALARSCNGYFLDVAQQAPALARLGAWAAPLVALGLPRPPESMAEAIGLQPTLTLSPWALAQAFRLLAEARPDLLAALRETPRSGTLSGLPESARLDGLALKTGTVRDLRSAPRVGLVIAVDADFVAVRAKAGLRPRKLAAELLDLLAQARALSGSDAAHVQALGLLEPSAIEARCAGVGARLHPAPGVPAGAFAPELIAGFAPLRQWTADGPAVCLAQPFRVRFPGVDPAGRDYAGVFRWSPPEPANHAPGVPRTGREARARRGSDFLFRTTRLQYAAGVARAEADPLSGEPRAALLRVIAHDERQPRHPGRPVCDTTHCQVFQGTSPPRPGDRDALARPPLPWPGWLHYAAGGGEPWEEERDAAQVRSVLGPGSASLRFDGGRAVIVRQVQGPDGLFEEPEVVPCEVVRGPLRLPSCPDRATADGAVVRFEGRGQGHGLGLDLDAAARSGLDQDEILRRAFGEPRSPDRR